LFINFIRKYLNKTIPKSTMAKISGDAWLIIGAAIAIISQIVNATTDNKAMTVFFYIGLLFALIGIIKLILQHASKKKQKPIHQHPAHHQVNHQTVHTHPHHITQQHQQQTTHHTTRHQQTQQHVHPQHSQQHQMFPQHITCKNCNARNHTQSNFCHRCGARLK
jgi:hypothetical protein